MKLGLIRKVGFGIGGAPSVLSPTVSNVQIPTTGVVGDVLTGTYTLGGGAPDTVTRRWYRGATLIFTSTTVDTYTPVQADAGNTSNITFNVEATNSGGSANATSNTLVVVYDASAWDYRNRVLAKGDTMTLSRLQLLQEYVYIPQKSTLDILNFGAGVNKGALHIYTAENTTQALENLLNSNFTATTINSPVFTPDAYYEGLASRAINSNWNASLLSLGTNEITVGAIFNNVPSSGFHIIGVQSSTQQNSVYTYVDATSVAARMLTSNERSDFLTNGRIGWHSLRRLGSSMIWNGNSLQASVSQAATGVYANLSFYDLALNINGSVSLGANRQQCMALKGAYINDTQLASLRTAIRDYCLAINPSLSI